MSPPGRREAEVETRLAAAEQALGVAFRDRTLLRTALTHPSWAVEHDTRAEYERLEFLGDSVLGFVVAEHLYRTMPEEPEGVLARLRAEVVAGAALAEAAAAAELDGLVLLGKGAAAEGGRKLASVRADVLEALIGAVYLDRGLSAARGVVERLVLPMALSRALAGTTRDPKGLLQEHTMAVAGGELPVYVVVSEEGPAHERRFEVEVLVGGEVIGRGSGPSKKIAEKAAAAQAVNGLGLGAG
jgi:ribonuclease III